MPNMQLTQTQVDVAIAAGLSLTDPESDLLEVFRKHATGILVLRSLLTAIANGTIGLRSLLQEEPSKKPESPETPPAPPSPKRKTTRKKRAAKRKPRPKKKK